VRRSYKFQIRPTTRQARSLAACIEDHRQLYNGALEERREAYRMRRVSISYGDQSAQLKQIRDTDSAGQGRWSFSSQQATLQRLDRSFAAFFRRVKAHQAPGYPRFKGRGWFDTVEMAEGPRRVPVGFSTEPARGPRLPAGHRTRQGQPASARAGHREDDLGEAGGSPLVRPPVL